MIVNRLLKITFFTGTSLDHPGPKIIKVGEKIDQTLNHSLPGQKMKNPQKMRLGGGRSDSGQVNFSETPDDNYLGECQVKLNGNLR